MRRLLACAALAALVLAPLACDLTKLGNQVSAKKVMVGTLLSTPEVTITPAAFFGADAGVPDGGFGNASFAVPEQTAALVFFGTREDEQGQPSPIANATVRLEQGDGGTVLLESEGLGTYGLTSNADGGLRYASGSDYRFTATLDGERFVGAVADAPPIERIDALHPQAGYVQHTASQPLRLVRPTPPAGRERNLGFVTVVPLSSNGEKGQPTFSNLPTTPLEFLELALSPIQWQGSNVDIPGTAFPTSNQTYLVIFQSARLGGPQSDNLFVGSTLLVGVADVGVVHTR